MSCNWLVSTGIVRVPKRENLRLWACKSPLAKSPGRCDQAEVLMALIVSEGCSHAQVDRAVSSSKNTKGRKPVDGLSKQHIKSKGLGFFYVPLSTQPPFILLEICLGHTLKNLKNSQAPCVLAFRAATLASSTHSGLQKSS